jgi:hypothetical protein
MIGIMLLASAAIASATEMVWVSFWANYPYSGTSNDVAYFSSGTQFTVEVYGVGGGSGNGHARIYDTSTLVVSAGAGAGDGQPFSASQTSSPVAAGYYAGMASGSTWSSGAYAYTKVIAKW